MRKVACPRCRQDYVIRVFIKPLQEERLLCPECDASWRTDQAVSPRTFVDYETYVNSRGHQNGWSLLEVMGPVEVS